MPRQAKLYQVVTFSTDPLHGNPAFVLSDVGDVSDRALMATCTILSTDVIAVIGDAQGNVTSLRFFTATGPHAGPGHSTLAAAHVVLRNGFSDGSNKGSITFHLPSGDDRTAYSDDDRLYVNFPTMPGSRIDRIAEMERALGARPQETWVAPFGYVAIYDDRDVVAGMKPDLERVASFDRTAIIATAPGGDLADIVIRVFAPNVGLPEDPVCGTAHRIIVPYWAGKLGKKKIHSRQLSPRGGDLWCEDKGETVLIGGETGLVITGTVRLPEE